MSDRLIRAFWRGVAEGIVWSAVFFAGLVTMIYFIGKIAQAVE